jgi:hypothetical protein
MITYRITCMFAADWSNLYPALFGAAQHCESRTDGNMAEFTFEDSAVKPADLGPLVRIEILPNS